MRNPQDNLKTYWLRQLEHADGKRQDVLKWVNVEWKQVAADWYELQSIPNF